ncbi:MAG: tRNA pseudouridine(55) synthase TruB [Clostridia bacterium]|nr:tRNA pseudouridine(55) synthase TruB [Clostridia bacterium]
MNGAVNFLKPPGMTSSDAVVWLRWVLQKKKCGHGGTLDPAACGVLPVLVGQGTKLFDRMLAHEKTYAATIRFGTATDTLDAEGVVTDVTDVVPTDAQLRLAMQDFVGEISQIPPQYSAVRVDGKHAYALARGGKQADIPARKVTIHKLSEPVWVDEKTVTIRVTCSSGTYIRTLAADIAESCGSLGYLTALTREQSGVFSIENAVTVEQLLKAREEGSVSQYVTSVEDLLCDLPKCHILPSAYKRAVNGATLRQEELQEEFSMGECRLYTPDDQLICLANLGEDHMIRPQIMLLDAQK